MPDRSNADASLGRGKRFAFALAPTALILVVIGFIEAGLRVTGLDRSAVRPAPLPAEIAGIHQADDDLFWTLRPNFDGDFQGVRIVTNGFGLRSPEPGPKEQGELRILSLGESTTFGAKVPGERTYSARLESLLAEAGVGDPVRVINAGVSAWTSFQSLKYLELHGLDLNPDIVLFYHEYNDDLPSTVRDFGGGEQALVSTDRQLYESRTRTLHRKLAEWSAIYRWLANRAARRALATMQKGEAEGLALQKGIVEARGGLRELRLPVRVTPEERRRNLAEVFALCRGRGIRLVVIHPSYGRSERHECVLTKFCAANHVPLFEAFNSLHPGGRGDQSLFLDPVHPSAEGHDRLARDLARFLVERGLVSPSAY